jgi:carbonic anhydrase
VLENPTIRRTVSAIESVINGNQQFAQTAAKDRVPALPFLPLKGLYIVTCIDPRVDPALFLKLEMGDAIVARGVGGRVTDEVVRDLTYISHLVQTKTPDGPWFEVAVIHHTDCGSALLAEPHFRKDFAKSTGFDEAGLEATAVTDPDTTVRADVARLLSAPHLSSRIKVTGHIYDVKSGLLRTIVE